MRECHIVSWQKELTSAAEKKDSSEVTVVASSSRSLWKLSTWGKIRVPSLSAKRTTQTLTDRDRNYLTSKKQPKTNFLILSHIESQDDSYQSLPVHFLLE